MNEYRVKPEGGGAWLWQLVDANGETIDQGPKVGSRADAIEGARDHRGDEREELYLGDGRKAGVLVKHRGPERLVILREDGSLYGEVDYAILPTADEQRIDIAPASEDSAAVTDG